MLEAVESRLEETVGRQRRDDGIKCLGVGGRIGEREGVVEEGEEFGGVGGRREARREKRSSDWTNQGWRRAQEMRETIGVGPEPRREEAARRRSGGSGGDGSAESAAERGAPERWRSASEEMRAAAAGRGNGCAEAPERMVGSAPGTVGRAPGAEESSSPDLSK
jgi:hypothetical protein